MSSIHRIRRPLFSTSRGTGPARIFRRCLTRKFIRLRCRRRTARRLGQIRSRSLRVSLLTRKITLHSLCSILNWASITSFSIRPIRISAPFLRGMDAMCCRRYGGGASASSLLLTTRPAPSRSSSGGLQRHQVGVDGPQCRDIRSESLVVHPLSELCQIGLKAAHLLERRVDEAHGAADPPAEHLHYLWHRRLLSIAFGRLAL